MKYLFTGIMFIWLALSISNCVPPSESAEDLVRVDYLDPMHRNIRDFQDIRNIRELRRNFDDDDMDIRYLAASAFGSIPTDEALIGLERLLNEDDSREVRMAAAYALGQSAEAAAEAILINSFGLQDTSEVNTEVRGTILEAVGKCGTIQSLNLIATASNYGYQDNHLLLGQARSIYRFGLRGITSPSGTAKMVSFVLDSQIPNETRLIASNYLHRNRNVDLTPYKFQLLQTLASETDPKIRMTLVQPLLRTGDMSVLAQVLDMLPNEADYRTQCNLIRGLASHNFNDFRDSIIQYLHHENAHVASVTSDLVLAKAGRDDVQTLLRLARQGNHTDYVKANLYAAALKAVPYYFTSTRNVARDEIIRAFQETSNPYHKAYYIKSLVQDALNYTHIIDLGINSGDIVITTTSINVLPEVLKGNKFNQIFRTTAAKNTVRESIVDALMTVMRSRNSGAIAAAANVLRMEDLGLKEFVLIKAPLREALRNLELPKDYDTKITLDKTMAFLDGYDYQEEKPAYNNPIDWSVLENLTDSSKAYIITNRGEIVVQLMLSQSPGSISNFVKLSNDDFYDGKTFHRVVPNFVIQGGCPRGDGYGSLDYTIRSELDQMYYDRQGYVGMASSGPDTEGTQWFITHSPTPHLDGKYSIFGRVISGMDVVHQIQVGDLIQDIRIARG